MVMGVCGIDTVVSPFLECFWNSSDKPLATTRLILAQSREAEHLIAETLFFTTVCTCQQGNKCHPSFAPPAQNPCVRMLMFYFENY